MAVGSYLSGEAVLLRSHPVLRFKADLVPSVRELHPGDRRFTVTACVKYFGRHLPDQLREWGGREGVGCRRVGRKDTGGGVSWECRGGGVSECPWYLIFWVSNVGRVEQVA